MIASSDSQGDVASPESTSTGPGDHTLYIVFRNGAVQAINGFWSRPATPPFFDGVSKILLDFHLHLQGSAPQSQYRYDTGGGVAVLFFSGIEGLIWWNRKATPPWTLPNPPRDLRISRFVFKNGAQVGNVPAIYSKAGDTAIGLNHLQQQFELFRRQDPGIARIGRFSFDYSGAVLDLGTIESILFDNIR